jgi:hypothetical protein
MKAVVRLERLPHKNNTLEDWIPGSELDAHPTNPLRVVFVWDPDFSKPLEIDPDSGGICYHIMNLKNAVKFVQNADDGMPGFFRVSKVCRGRFQVRIGSHIFVGFHVQKWVFAPISFICILYEEYIRIKQMGRFAISDANGIEIDIGKSLTDFKKAIWAAPKVRTVYSAKYLEHMGDKLTSADRDMVGLFYLESSDYLQYAGADIEIQMYPVGYHNRFAELTSTERNRVFESRKLFFCDEEYIKHFAIFIEEQQRVCRMVSCADSANPNNNCCFKKSCNGVCGDKRCCYKRECVNTPDIFDVLFDDWTTLVADETSQSFEYKIIQEAFAQHDGEYDEPDVIYAKLNGCLEEETLKKIILMCKISGDAETITHRLDQELNHTIAKGIGRYAFRKFMHQNRALMIQDNVREAVEGLAHVIDEGKSPDEYFKFVKTRHYQTVARDRVKILYNQAIDSWRKKKGLPPIRRTPLTDAERAASFIGSKQNSRSKNQRSKKTRKSK